MQQSGMKNKAMAWALGNIQTSLIFLVKACKMINGIFNFVKTNLYRIGINSTTLHLKLSNVVITIKYKVKTLLG